MRLLAFTIGLVLLPALMSAPAHAAGAKDKRAQKIAAAALKTAGIKGTQAPFYQPLVRPGMPGRYDIAGWHGKKPSGLLQKTKATKASAR